MPQNTFLKGSEAKAKSHHIAPTNKKVYYTKVYSVSELYISSQICPYLKDAFAAVIVEELSIIFW